MNAWTANALINIALIILTGFTFYLTGSAWSFAILLFMSGAKEVIKYDNGED